MISRGIIHMKKLGLIVGILAVAVSVALDGKTVQASSYHNGIPTAIRGSWRDKPYNDTYYVFHFGKSYISNHAVYKSNGRWHNTDIPINNVNTFNVAARYRKISAHSYYLLPKKGYPVVKDANGVKIVKQSSKKMAVKYHYAGYGLGAAETLYKK